jgi:hypothetical protein
METHQRNQLGFPLYLIRPGSEGEAGPVVITGCIWFIMLELSTNLNSGRKISLFLCTAVQYTKVHMEWSRDIPSGESFRAGGVAGGRCGITNQSFFERSPPWQTSVS